MARANLTVKEVRVPTKLVRATAIAAKFTDHDGALDLSDGIRLGSGTIPSARLNLATIPTNTDTIGIGGHTFTFLTTLVGAGATTQVKIGTAAATRTALIAAINGTVSADVVAATVPHTVAIVADLVDTSRVRVRKATAKGGTATTASKATSIALAEALTAVADIWDRANLNETGKAANGKTATSSIAITAEMLAATKAYIEFPFTPTDLSYTVKTTAGATLPCTDLITIEGDAVKIALAGGAAPNLVATNVVVVTVSA